jgi:hypothetical protein
MTYNEIERGTGMDLAGDNPSHFQRILFDSEQLILSAQTRHVMKKKVYNTVLESKGITRCPKYDGRY